MTSLVQTVHGPPGTVSYDVTGSQSDITSADGARFAGGPPGTVSGRRSAYRPAGSRKPKTPPPQRLSHGLGDCPAAVGVEPSPPPSPAALQRGTRGVSNQTG